MGPSTDLMSRRRQTKTPRPDPQSIILLPRHLNPALRPQYPNLPSRPPRIQILLFPARHLRRKVRLPRWLRSHAAHLRNLSPPPRLRNNPTNSRCRHKEVCGISLGGTNFIVPGDAERQGEKRGEGCYVCCFYSSACA